MSSVGKGGGDPTVKTNKLCKKKKKNILLIKEILVDNDEGYFDMVWLEMKCEEKGYINIVMERISSEEKDKNKYRLVGYRLYNKRSTKKEE